MTTNIYYEIGFWENDKFFDTYGDTDSIEKATIMVKELKLKYPDDDIRIIKHTEEILE